MASDSCQYIRFGEIPEGQQRWAARGNLDHGPSPFLALALGHVRLARYPGVQGRAWNDEKPRGVFDGVRGDVARIAASIDVFGRRRHVVTPLCPVWPVSRSFEDR